MRNQNEVKEGSKSGETKLRIVEAALELFREKGFDATTMRDIAGKARVATGAAYYYFPSKDAIVLDFYRQTTADLDGPIEDVFSGSTDLQKRLAGLIDIKLRYLEPSRRLLTALASHVDPDNPCRHSATRRGKSANRISLSLRGRCLAVRCVSPTI